ncbi:type I methionyl aminopeptidase [Terricaulis sp.]|uniref:type I methionyl aminopeptidase n=1 Tax=Terricaulis sp. TaxID=2768686 RepID=UPI002AC62E3E|nr:type I methionyl aminopeptidase [Terricaulis sp.]MDZ4691924.1 type I methionyl aminopeptidase [Terricaulis sp.]
MNYVQAVEAPERNTGQIKLHDRAQAFAGMHAAGKIAAGCLDMLAAEVRDGVTTARIDDLARQYVFDHGALPACVFYRGYRHTVCTSLNHVVCHGIPGDRVLRSGDILNIDVTAIFEGWHGDTSRMYAVGDIPRKAERLMDITYDAMMRGIAAIKPGATLGDLGYAIQSYAESERLSVVREFCGHGLGRIFHDAPNILHYGKPGQSEELKPGMMFTVEPMLNLGAPGVKVLADGWTAVTKDKSLTAQYEHSIGITEDGVEIFTKSPAGIDQPHKTPG